MIRRNLKNLFFPKTFHLQILNKINYINKSFFVTNNNSDESVTENASKYKETFYNKRQKQRKRELLKKEIETNPEFVKAFPHLVETGAKYNEESMMHEFEFKTDEPKKRQWDFFESSRKQHQGYDLKEEFQKRRENEKNFSDAYSKKEGPKKYMSREEKEKIHHEIDEKMAELESTNLSREEILFEGRTVINYMLLYLKLF
jgi:hypothetical protein